MAGTIFFISMLVMAVFADYLAVAMPEQLPNLFIGTFTIYLVATAWLTVRRKEQSIGIAEKIALAVILCLFIPFAILSFQLATGLAPSFKSATPLEGPVRIAIYCFTFFVAMAAIGDARLVLAGGITGARRILTPSTHVWGRIVLLCKGKPQLWAAMLSLIPVPSNRRAISSAPSHKSRGPSNY
ncbi:MAG: hypothetical protein WBW83_02705 [Terriglobales bacterium]